MESLFWFNVIAVLHCGNLLLDILDFNNKEKTYNICEILIAISLLVMLLLLVLNLFKFLI